MKTIYSREDFFKLVFQLPYHEEIDLRKSLEFYLNENKILDKTKVKRGMNLYTPLDLVGGVESNESSKKHTRKTFKGINIEGNKIQGSELREKRKKNIMYLDFEFMLKIYLDIYDNLEEIDELIQSKVNKWKIDRLNKEVLGILRTITYELKYLKNIHIGTSINAGVELAKTYGEDGKDSLVHAVLQQIGKDVR